ncbi:MAG: type II secretion system protein M [Pseudomonadota bacterium]|nr:type II secretion system protein M [Pseudomonadota bacterium]
MSADNAATLPPGAAGARQQAGQFWRSRAPRERQLIVAMTLAVAFLIVWLIAVQPALKTLHDTPAELDRLDMQWQQMQLAALESASLRSASPVPPAQATEALRAATERLSGKGKIALQGDRAVLTFSGVPFEDLRNWLGEVRSAARARPVEAQLLKGASGYSGSISIVLGGSS